MEQNVDEIVKETNEEYFHSLAVHVLSFISMAHIQAISLIPKLPSLFEAISAPLIVSRLCTLALVLLEQRINQILIQGQNLASLINQGSVGEDEEDEDDEQEQVEIGTGNGDNN
ncbi:MAG: hypothetical protein EZS28_048695, partial [Streblomastix strix]